MSKAYRKWKEELKAKKPFRKPEIYAYREIYDWVEVQMRPTSMRTYRKEKHAKEMEAKRERKYGKPKIGLNLQMMCNPYHQVSEEERIRQANEYWRQK